jgi:hypothetical protein
MMHVLMRRHTRHVVLCMIAAEGTDQGDGGLMMTDHRHGEQ